MRVSVDPWDPSYGTSFDTEALGDPTAAVNVAVERPVTAWAPISPPAVEPPDEIVFVDGVRRVEARVWVESDVTDPDGEVAAGLCASWAAGAVRCNGGPSRVVAASVGRGLFTASPHGRDLVTAHGRFACCITPGATPEALSLALQERMTAAELDVAADSAAAGALLVVDGPLRGRQHLTGAVGVVKTHHVDYLPAEVRPVLRALGAGQRTPVFTIGTTWSRHSWYLRLPAGTGLDNGAGGPMAGIVRVEASATQAIADVTALADLTAAVLPRFASTPHKDPRAPQNLVPIAGLERELRRRLGDPRLLYRALRSAAA